MTVTPTEGLNMTEETATVEETTPSNLADRQGDVAADYLEGLLDILDLDGDIEIEIKGDRALVSIVEAILVTSRTWWATTERSSAHCRTSPGSR